MRRATPPHQPSKPFGSLAYRLLSAFVILALCLPAGPFAGPAQAADIVTPDLPTDPAPTDVVTSEVPLETPVELPTVTETATETPTIPVETPTQAPTTGATPTPASADTADESTTSPLQFYFTVSPEQATPGSEVIFSLVIVNNGKTEIANVAFSNELPAEFNEVKGGFEGLAFNPEKRTLTWHAGKQGVLGAGETATTSYSVQLSETSEEGKIIETASVSADGLAGPITAEATLVIASADKTLASVDAGGGRAAGLASKVQVDVPEGAVLADQMIAVQDLAASYPTTDDQPWLAFKLDLLAETETALNANTETEQDRRVQLEPVEAKFEKPVALTVSFDGLADLATMGAEYEPFIVTLDDASGVWVRMPTTFDREANTVTAETDHFSTWGAGIGPNTPQNGAGILLFDSAYPDLFTGRSHFSIPIWTPPGRNSLAPSLALSYSSGTADGILGDIQAPWAGMGWSIGVPEIARKITSGACSPCGQGSFGYKDEYI